MYPLLLPTLPHDLFLLGEQAREGSGTLLQLGDGCLHLCNILALHQLLSRCLHCTPCLPPARCLPLAGPSGFGCPVQGLHLHPQALLEGWPAYHHGQWVGWHRQVLHCQPVCQLLLTLQVPLQGQMQLRQAWAQHAWPGWQQLKHHWDVVADGRLLMVCMPHSCHLWQQGCADVSPV
jgi:hypothetical protein